MPAGEDRLTQFFQAVAASEQLQQFISWLAENAPNKTQGEQLGDMEFAQEVAPYLDPQDLKHLDPKAARYVPMTPAGNKYYGQRGLNTRGFPADQTAELMKVLPWALYGDAYPPNPGEVQNRDYGQRKPINVRGGEVYAFGAENANPLVWAHEFRHDAPRVVLQNLKSNLSAEEFNRMEDLWHARTPRDKELAKGGIRDQLIRNTNDMPDPEQVERAIKILMEVAGSLHDKPSPN